jgi:hypothetical protein
MTNKTTRDFYITFKQLVQHIPPKIIPQLSQEYEIQTRKFSVMSQIIAVVLLISICGSK